MSNLPREDTSPRVWPRRTGRCQSPGAAGWAARALLLFWLVRPLLISTAQTFPSLPRSFCSASPIRIIYLSLRHSQSKGCSSTFAIRASRSNLPPAAAHYWGCVYGAVQGKAALQLFPGSQQPHPKHPAPAVSTSPSKLPLPDVLWMEVS